MVGSATAERAEPYQRGGRVTIDSVSESGARLRARVQGSQAAPYSVVIALSRSAGRLRLDDSCTCAVGRRCKHVAATLLELVRNPPAPAPAAAASAATIAALPPEVDTWLQSLDLARNRTSEDYPAEVRQRLLYLLAWTRTNAGDRLLVRTVTIRLLKDGKHMERSERELRPHQALTGQPARFLRPNDLEILSGIQQMAQRAEAYFPDGAVLAGPGSARLLEAMIRTQRCHWERSDMPALTIGETRPATPSWRTLAGGAQQLVLAGESIDEVLPTLPPWYLDRTAGQCGPIESDLPDAVVAALASAPPVPRGATAALAVELERRFPGRKDLLPQSAGTTRRISSKPTVHVHVAMPELKPLHPGQRQSAQANGIILVQLGYDYDGVRIQASLPGKSVTRPQGDGNIAIIERDTGFEKATRKELTRAGFAPASGWGTIYALDEESRAGWALPIGSESELALNFASVILPRWQAIGWQVELAPDWPFSFAEIDGEFTIDLKESTGLDWFEFDLGAVVDGARVNLLPALVPLLGRLGDDIERLGMTAAIAEFAKRESKTVISLADGRRVGLPLARLLPFLVAIMELFAGQGLTKDGRVRLSRLRAAELAALEESTKAAAQLRWLGGERLLDLGRRLAAFSSIASVEPPENFKGELRAYQRDGLAWLQFLRGYGLNGILADDMGLGKTVQTLGHLLIEKHSGRADRPSLVVAPTSLIPNWRLESERFTPDLRVVVWHGPDRASERIDNCDLVLTSYALLARDRELLARQLWHIVILDEAQAIKNPQSIATQAVQTLEARHRLCLTGTPLENHLGELWSLMHFLNPGLLGDRARFGRDFRHPIEKRGDGERRDALVRRVRPFLLRRTKDAVERDLPAKTEIVERLELEPHQRDVYESVRLAAYGRVREEIASKGLARSHIVVLDALLKLRQVCCDPRLLKLTRAGKGAGSAKLARLMEMLPELLDEGRRVLVFSQFTSMLSLIEDELKAAGIEYLLLTGDTADRTTPVRRFQAGEVPVFLISLKAGGVGLNLTAADTVILYDPWWNPAVEAQAIDRAHRIGQDKPVFAYRLLTIGTVEEKMLELQGRKRALADALLSGSATATSEITETDLEALFAPLEASDTAPVT